jgi:hypothetical protein
MRDWLGLMVNTVFRKAVLEGQQSYPLDYEAVVCQHLMKHDPELFSEYYPDYWHNCHYNVD